MRSDDGFDACGHHRVAGRVLLPGRRAAQTLPRDGFVGRDGEARAVWRRAVRERPDAERAAELRPLVAPHGPHYGRAAARRLAGRRALLLVRSSVNS